MNESTVSPPAENTSPRQRELDPEQVEMLQTLLKAQQNLPLGIAAGLLSALVGAILWAVITVATQYQIGYMAIGVGYMVGFAVRKAGKGTTKIFGVVGAVCALLGCLSGNLLSTCGFIAREESVPLLDVIVPVFSQPAIMVELLAITFSPMDILFYGIAIHGGYKTALRTLTAEEIRKITT